MPKFFVENNQIKNDTIYIKDKDVNHIKKVLRKNIEDEITICNENTKQDYLCKITNIEENEITCKILKELETNVESNIEVSIFQGLPKADKMELIIQKSVELGVNAIIPVAMKRCVAKIESKDENKNRIIKSSELIEIIEARIEEMFSIINKDITNNGLKHKINNVVLTGQGIVNINKSDVAGKINLNIPVKISTGRAISTVKPAYRTSYALVRYIAARPFAKTVSSSIDTQNNENFFKNIIERIKEFFYT